ncbi:hypothetical protein NQ095_02090 [Rossellomorea sp. SC111]|nr:hypothetical protein [Rossellomorea sp. SC111]MCR8847184.1 hypothetical protein [Rossellomorea sp. SC111]
MTKNNKPQQQKNEAEFAQEQNATERAKKAAKQQNQQNQQNK